MPQDCSYQVGRPQRGPCCVTPKVHKGLSFYSSPEIGGELPPRIRRSLHPSPDVSLSLDCPSARNGWNFGNWWARGGGVEGGRLVALKSPARSPPSAPSRQPAPTPAARRAPASPPSPRTSCEAPLSAPASHHTVSSASPVSRPPGRDQSTRVEHSAGHPTALGSNRLSAILWLCGLGVN